MPEYKFQASNGREYTLEASSDDAAQRMAQYVERRIVAGDPELTVAMQPDEFHDPQTSVAGSFLSGALSGLYANWEDEIMAFGNAAVPGLSDLENFTSGNEGSLEQRAFWNTPQGFWSAFNQNMDAYRREREAQIEQHPTARLAGQVTGIGTSILPINRIASTALNLAARAAPRVVIPAAARASAAAIGSPTRYAAARGAAQGGGMGVVAGAGEGEGNRAQSAALGGLTGAAAGAVLDPAVSALIPQVGHYIRFLTGNSPNREAVAQIATALARDGFDVTSPAGVQALRAELSRYMGRPVSLADIGQATRARTGVALRWPSGAQSQGVDMVGARAAASGDRLSADIRANIAPRTDVHALDDALVEQRRLEAETLRERALFEGGEAPPVQPLELPPAPAASSGVSNPPGGNVEDLQGQWREAQLLDPDLSYDEFVERMVPGRAAETAPPLPTAEMPRPSLPGDVGYQGRSTPPATMPDPVRMHTAGDEMFADALDAYIANPSGYRTTYGITRESIEHYLQGIEQRFAPLPSDMSMRRGMVMQGSDLDAALAAGELNFGRPSSFTTNPRIADDYADIHPHSTGQPDLDEALRSVLIETERRAGSRAIHADPISGDPMDEYILPSGRFRISGSRQEGGSTILSGSFDELVPATPAGGAVDEVGVAEAGGRQTRVTSDPVLRALVDTELGKRALSAALARSRHEIQLLQAQGLPTEHLGAGIFDETQIQQLMENGGPLDMRTLDTLKRFLDDEVSSLFRRGQSSTFSAGEAHQVRQLRDALRGRMRTEVPEYGDYLDQYSGSSDMIEALRAGRGNVRGEPPVGPGFDQLDPERIAAQQAGRSTAAQELYRVGAARRLEDIVRGTDDARAPAQRLQLNDTQRARLEALGLEPGAAQNFTTAIEQERTLGQLTREAAGGNEARRLAQEDADVSIGGLVPFNPFSKWGWFGAGLRGAGNVLSTSRNAAVNEALLPRMLETNPQAIDNIIAELEAHGAHDLAARIRASRRGSFAGRAAGTLLGGPVALPTDREIPYSGGY